MWWGGVSCQMGRRNGGRGAGGRKLEEAWVENPVKTGGEEIGGWKIVALTKTDEPE